MHQRVEVRATGAVVEIFRNNERIATHQRKFGPRGTSVTDPAHRPESHRDRVWPPARVIGWGAKFGPAVARVVELTIGRYVNPEQGYRACLGLLRVAERHPARMNAACKLALSAPTPGGPRRKYIESILKKGLDQKQQTPQPTRGSVPAHENVPGADYYDNEETVH